MWSGSCNFEPWFPLRRGIGYSGHTGYKVTGNSHRHGGSAGYTGYTPLKGCNRCNRTMVARVSPAASSPNRLLLHCTARQGVPLEPGQGPLAARRDRPGTTPITSTIITNHAMPARPVASNRKTTTMPNEPKLRPDEMGEYKFGFQAGHRGEDFKTEYGHEPDSHAVMRGYRDGCECRKGEQKFDRSNSKTPDDYEREVGFVNPI